MKNQLFIFLGLGLLACGNPQPVSGQVTSDNQKQKTTVNHSLTKKKVLYVDNINGYIYAEGYSGDKIDIQVDEEYKAKTPELLSKAKNEVKCRIEETADTTYVEIVTPECDCNARRSRREWKNHHGDRGYDYKFDFRIKVPQDMTVILKTINNGNIEVKNFNGQVQANNINGALTLENVGRVIEARTINGDVKVSLKKNPEQESYYYTLNGDLRVIYPNDLSADIQLKSFNGDFYSDYTFQTLPNASTKIDKQKEGKTTYKVSEYSTIRIGKGGKTQKLETFNGDIFINKGE